MILRRCGGRQGNSCVTIADYRYGRHVCRTRIEAMSSEFIRASVCLIRRDAECQRLTSGLNHNIAAVDGRGNGRSIRISPLKRSASPLRRLAIMRKRPILTAKLLAQYSNNGYTCAPIRGRRLCFLQSLPWRYMACRSAPSRGLCAKKRTRRGGMPGYCGDTALYGPGREGVSLQLAYALILCAMTLATAGLSASGGFARYVWGWTQPLLPERSGGPSHLRQLTHPTRYGYGRYRDECVPLDVGDEAALAFAESGRARGAAPGDSGRGCRGYYKADEAKSIRISSGAEREKEPGFA